MFNVFKCNIHKYENKLQFDICSSGLGSVAAEL